MIVAHIQGEYPYYPNDPEKQQILDVMLDNGWVLYQDGNYYLTFSGAMMWDYFRQLQKQGD